jgi:tRNA dimethylallyltransferase
MSGTPAASSSVNDPPSPLFLVGPTAVGKSEIALLLAERLGGEVISVDSMQVYRGLNIGTAKPSTGARARVPHHLIDVVELTEPFDAARFVALAATAVNGIRAGGRLPIFCGGTGLYFKAFLEGLGEAPPPDGRLRAELESTPQAELLRELSKRDPVMFGKIDHRNPRRVIRALEVIRLTGRPFSGQRAAWRSPPSTLPPRPSTVLGLSRSHEDLRARIDGRVDAMFACGLVEETRQLLLRGLEQNRTAMQALGYRQVVEHLRGGRSLPDTIALIKQRTRQFARRQMTWFRRQLPVEWIALAPADGSEAIVERLLAQR